MTQNEETLATRLKIERLEKCYYLQQKIGSGECDGTAFDLFITVPQGATLVRVDDVSYVINIESFVRFAVEEERKRAAKKA